MINNYINLNQLQIGCFPAVYLSLDWFRKAPFFFIQWFPVDFPLNQSNESRMCSIFHRKNNGFLTLSNVEMFLVKSLGQKPIAEVSSIALQRLRNLVAMSSFTRPLGAVFGIAMPGASWDFGIVWVWKITIFFINQ